MTSPLARAWKTTEGILVILLDLILVGTAAIDPSTVSPKTAAIVIGAQHVALLAQRGLIKAIALSKVPAVAAVLDAPDPVKVAETELLADAAASEAPQA